MDDAPGTTNHDVAIAAPDDAQWCREISARIHAGDPDAESEMIRRFEPGLRLVSWRAVSGDRDRVGDICQETLMIVLQRLRKRPLEDPARLAAFAAQTARNLALTDYRKNRQRFQDGAEEILPRLGDPAPRPVETLHLAAAATAVRDLLPEMRSDRDREVLERVYVRDQDKTTVCRDMALPEALFNQVLSRARRRFREILETHGYQKHDFL